MDNGDRHVVFMIEPEDWDIVREGEVSGFIIPREVHEQDLHQVLAEIRDQGGLQYVVIPKLPPLKNAGPRTDFERLAVRMQARRVAQAYRARGLEPPGAAVTLLADDTDEQRAADNAGWNEWCHSHGLRPLLSLARADTVMIEGDDDFEATWRCEREIETAAAV